jgi:undecaprenyl-diphosphatase
LDARDRALFQRAALDEASRWSLTAWRVLTHMGGAITTIVACLYPLITGNAAAGAARLAAGTLLISHVAVQIIKRTVGRPRPSRAMTLVTQVAEPDRFSFPSGHSAAAMSVAFGYAMTFPPMAMPLLVAAVLVGASRVRLGVHYPGDVIMGQLLALVTGALLRAM